ncbi:50S ribosomal protein L23 [Patescibacteria group bacterium]|nr:50S ribosomal protein L23 [Patescibacteria group bacterium]
MLDQIIKSPIVTEKSTKEQKLRKYTFLVTKRATKIDVANVIGKLYGVKVKKVNMVPIQEKSRMAKRGIPIIKRPKQKKAIITLEKDQTLDIHKLSKK